MEYVYIALVIGLSFVFTWFWKWIFEFRKERRIAVLEDIVESHDMAFKGIRSGQVRAEKSEQTQIGMMQLAEIWKGEGTKEEKIQASLPLVLQNPQLLKEGMKLMQKL